MLQGVIVLYALATPTMGFSKSRSVNPTARSIDAVRRTLIALGNELASKILPHDIQSSIENRVALP